MTTQSVQPTALTQPLRGLPSTLVPGLLLIIASAVQGDGALITAAYRNASPISDEQLSYPWADATATTTSLLWGTTQVLFVVGLMAFARSGAAPSKAGQVGGGSPWRVPCSTSSPTRFRWLGTTPLSTTRSPSPCCRASASARCSPRSA